MTETIPYKGLVVSCQALENEPLHGSHHMSAMAKAAEMGGAVGIRANSPSDITAIKKVVNLPVIGLFKKKYAHYDLHITPTVEDALAVHRSGADIVAIDGTERTRPDHKTLKETIAKLKQYGIRVMADVSTFEEGMSAAKYGADYVSTTLSGYTPYSKKQDGPDFELVTALSKVLSVPVAAEGRIRSPQEAVAALEAGAHFVVVGGAITRPQFITQMFTYEINKHMTAMKSVMREK